MALNESSRLVLNRRSPSMEESTPWSLRILLTVCLIVLIAWTVVIFVGPIALAFEEQTEWCPLYNATTETSNATFSVFKTPLTPDQEFFYNPVFDTDPCYYTRLPQLLGLTLEECEFCRRLLTSIVLGGLIGYERRSADRPAGIRTMGLVALGACSFTISSIAAFRTSTMIWDSSRVSAALPSGVGFLGGALIWKGKVLVDDQEQHQVHGLTTAASLWLSAAVGIGSGGGLYFVTIYSTIIVLLVLRYGPKLYLSEPKQPDETTNVAEETKQDPELMARLVPSERPSRPSANNIPTFES